MILQLSKHLYRISKISKTDIHLHTSVKYITEAGEIHSRAWQAASMRIAGFVLF